MKIVNYPHPTLRYRSKPVARINRRLRDIVAEMLDLMYEAEGIGLAANQVDLPLRLFVMNLAGKRGEGEEMVWINPELTQPRGSDEKEEGCLSLPGLYAPVRRPERIQMSAYNLQGELVEAELSGLASRVVQHETDHLDGVLFIDRLNVAAEMSIRESLQRLEQQYEEQLAVGAVGSETTIAQRRTAWEEQFCQLP